MFIRHGLVVLLIGAIVWSAPGAQAVVSGPAPPDSSAARVVVDDPPHLSDPDVDPSSLPAAGGPITVSVTVTDDHGVQLVQALIGDSEGLQTYLDLEPEPGSETRYTGSWTVPPNDSAEPAPYTVWFRAFDENSEGNGVTVDFDVAGAEPATTRLSLSKGRLSFGPVRAGRTVLRTVVLRNQGTEAVECTVRSSARRFRLPGRRDMALTLGPGQTKRVKVRYRAAAAGRHWSRLRVVRADGQQPGLRVVLRGTALRRR